jgi:hypothetical protein
MREMCSPLVGVGVRAHSHGNSPPSHGNSRISHCYPPHLHCYTGNLHGYFSDLYSYPAHFRSGIKLPVHSNLVLSPVRTWHQSPRVKRSVTLGTRRQKPKPCMGETWQHPHFTSYLGLRRTCLTFPCFALSGLFILCDRNPRLRCAGLGL